MSCATGSRRRRPIERNRAIPSRYGRGIETVFAPGRFEVHRGLRQHHPIGEHNMASHHHPLKTGHHHQAKAVWTRKLSPRLIERGAFALFVVIADVALFRAVNAEAQDPMLALLASLVSFLAIGSLFKGDDRRP